MYEYGKSGKWVLSVGYGVPTGDRSRSLAFGYGGAKAHLSSNAVSVSGGEGGVGSNIPPTYGAGTGGAWVAQ